VGVQIVWFYLLQLTNLYEIVQHPCSKFGSRGFEAWTPFCGMKMWRSWRRGLYLDFHRLHGPKQNLDSNTCVSPAHHINISQLSALVPVPRPANFTSAIPSIDARWHSALRFLLLFQQPFFFDTGPAASKTCLTGLLVAFLASVQ
jgi:hypothetical protein